MGTKAMMSAAVIAALALTGCSGTKAVDETSSEPGAAAAAPTAAPKSQAVLKRLQQVSTSDIAMGADFNLDLLRLGFRSLGFDETESTCGADVIAQTRAEGFASLTVSELFSAESMTPEVLLPCISVERLSQVGPGSTPAQLPADIADQFRDRLSMLAEAGYESAGLSGPEASCVSDATNAATPADASATGLAGVAGGTATGALTIEIVESCITAERMTQLAG